MLDQFARRIRYLRVSVTDRCNMRCTYCMPVEGINKLHRKDILNYDELFSIAREAVTLGIEKIGAPGSTAAVAMLTDAVKKGGAFA